MGAPLIACCVNTVRLFVRRARLEPPSSMAWSLLVWTALLLPLAAATDDQASTSSVDLNQRCERELCDDYDYGPHSAYVPCHFLPYDFLECEELLSRHHDNTTDSDGIDSPPSKEAHSRLCSCYVLGDIDCFGNRTFIRDGVPCQQHKGHYFVTTLLFSLLLGFLGMDRFYLGHTGTAIGKMLTIGGVGIWWIVDIILLVTGNLTPEDGSDWMPYA